MPSLSESPVIARFFKVMVPGFHTKLRLPPAFCMKLKGEIPEEAFLTSCKGTWRVEIGQCSEGRICFLEGWDNFVKNHDLKIGEFVVFEQTGCKHFDATVFDSTTCTKEFPLKVHKEVESSAPSTDEHAEIVKRGRGRPRKRAAHIQQKGFHSDTLEAEATSGPNVDEHARKYKRGRGRPRQRLASPEQRESSVEILEEKAPLGRNFFGHTIRKSRRGRPRIRTESLQQKETIQYNMNHDFPFENEFKMKINEEKELYRKYVHEYTIETRGRISNGAASHWKQNHFMHKIMAYNINHPSPGLYIPPSICQLHHISEKASISLRGPSREWHEVSVKQHSMGRFCMRNGWREFCTSNNVQLGDICLFKIIRKDTRASSETIMMDVKISKTRI